ncbi:hypothetical protein [Paenibacillus sp. S150]|uniref:hypothetical protein n=1 Tax=Paenibacillus sp. S150 TaxID=2749826 RepID=UPI001C5901CF|nr:hypothetical protein [Paenibacillus sp. S150]MBW4084870.1 hypothetical protein [Paenibacillus sp. S150]
MRRVPPWAMLLWRLRGGAPGQAVEQHGALSLRESLGGGGAGSLSRLRVPAGVLTGAWSSCPSGNRLAAAVPGHYRAWRVPAGVLTGAWSSSPSGIAVQRPSASSI